jgi:hypothetical protein
MSECDFGPLEGLVGVWKGDKGLDIAPEPDGPEESPFYETLTIEKVGDVKNAGSQVLVALRYHQVVCRKDNHCVFHDQLGYWIWDAERKIIMQSLQIPRAVSLIAGGKVSQEGSKTIFLVNAKDGDADWGITQQPFMRDHAKTLEFSYEATLEGNHLSYREMTLVDIYGKKFEHVDSNQLTKS